MAICPIIVYFSTYRVCSMHDVACQFACAVRMRRNISVNVLKRFSYPFISIQYSLNDLGKMFEWFSHPFILTLCQFNVLRKVFKRFVVWLGECSIRLMGISGKTLKMVSFHTGSRGVLYKIFEGIRFQQTQNRIACLQFEHVH